MSEVFYRKWRPQRLDQVVGQEATTQTLRQAVSLERVAHAYLFCGPRGTGKTSTARILARAVNCLSPQEGEPDNDCQICRSMNEGRALDLIEIDAASNRGIDDIRALSEKIHFTPNEARYKVYIVDEVHMLTEYAYNALLKTLEEPPAHAILVLATTEPHKVPLTIVSRCQRFDFRRIPLERMVDKLAEICRDEEVQTAPEALQLIARTASGSLRDAENLLEQVVVSYGSPISEEQVRDLLGMGGDAMALELATHTVHRAVKDGLTVINQVATQGNDLRQLHRGAMEYLRGVLLLKADAGMPLGYADDTTADLRSLAEAATMGQLVHALKTFARVDLRHDGGSPLRLELALVESCTGSPSPQEEARPAASIPEASAVHARPPESRRRAATPPPVSQRPPPVRAKPVTTEPDVPTGESEAAASEPETALERQWGEIVKSLRHTGKRFKLGALLRGCIQREVDNGVITLKFTYLSHVERVEQELSDPETRRAVQEVLARVMGSPYDVQVSLAAADNDATGRRASRRSQLVRAAQAMGARVVDEKEEDSNEQEDAPAGTAASAAHPQAPGGA